MIGIKPGMFLEHRGYDADAATYFDAIATAGSSITQANKNAVNALVIGLKADSLWGAIKVCCLLAGPDDLTGALVPLVGAAPTNVNFVSGDHSRTGGLVGDGSTKRLALNRNNNADPQNSQHAAVWVTTKNGGNEAFIGVGGGSESGTTQVLHNSGSLQSRIRGTSTNFAITASGATAGFNGCARSGSSAASHRSNGTTTAITYASSTPYNEDMSAFSRGSSSRVFSPSRLAYYSVGESLDLELLDARLATYVAALS